jgi:DNA-binding transcriptional MerR regulator
VSRYRIRAVAELTGVPSATLRAWERRYGVPAPSRTASAYRLYGDADVAQIVRMRDLVASGVAPAEAARAWRDHAAGAEGAFSADVHQAARERIVSAALRFDVEAMREEVTRTLALGPAADLFDRTLAPALVEVGDHWHEGNLTVAEEHVLSGLLLGRLAQLLELIQPVGSSRRAALACFEEEDHVIGLYGVGLHFASWGYRSSMLGQRTPPEAVARVVSRLEVDVVALSVTTPPPASRARALVDAYADACEGVAWIVGGQGAASIRRFVEARGGLVSDEGFPHVRRMIDRAVRKDRRSPDPGEGTAI